LFYYIFPIGTKANYEAFSVVLKGFKLLIFNIINKSNDIIRKEIIFKEIYEAEKKQMVYLLFHIRYVKVQGSFSHKNMHQPKFFILTLKAMKQ